MRNVNKLLGIGLFVALAMGMSGCKGKEGTKGPDGKSGGIGSTAKGQAGAKPTKEAKEDFAKAVAKYNKLKGDGKIDGKECEQAADAFIQVFKEHGKPMVAAYFNAGAIYDECGNLEKAEKIYKDVINADSTYDLAYNNHGVTYGDVFLENEKQMSKWNFEVADTEALFDLFRKAVAECKNCLENNVPIAAYEQAIEASHVFNLLQARGVISVQERASYMAQVRDLARGSCEAYMAKEKDRWAEQYEGWVA